VLLLDFNSAVGEMDLKAWLDKTKNQDR